MIALLLYLVIIVSQEVLLEAVLVPALQDAISGNLTVIHRRQFPHLERKKEEVKTIRSRARAIAISWQHPHRGTLINIFDTSVLSAYGQYVRTTRGLTMSRGHLSVQSTHREQCDIERGQ